MHKAQRIKVLVIAPHPDDEVLGLGGTIARYVDEGNEVHVLIVTRGDPSMFDPASVEQLGRESAEAHRVLGIHKTMFMDGFPAALLDTIPHARLNAALGEVIAEVDPQVVYVPFYGDLHLDHRLVFESAMVAIRPRQLGALRLVYAYETLSETNWNAAYVTPPFVPTDFVDVSPYLERKLEAMGAYQSQLKEFPHARSLESLRALARHRGATIGFEAAEAFMLIRAVHPVTDEGKVR
jgi:LmbE family N-acetylglucosaminyl deacetylase